MKDVWAGDGFAADVLADMAFAEFDVLGGCEADEVDLFLALGFHGGFEPVGEGFF
ncbi:MAG: hypothetical protein Q4F41_14270 [Eubacteriales bacterium]|nr:hypothetical protein [Eubacteriales bacterium]